MLKNKILYFLFFIQISAFAQAPKYSNEFLTLGVGARNLAMSNTGVSSVTDVNAAYYNPAGLSELKNKSELSVMHAEYFAGIAKYDYGGFATRLKDSGVLAVSFLRFGVDEIQNTLFLYGESGTGAPDYDNISTFSVADNAFLISYSKELPIENLYFGGSVKVIYRQVGDFAKAWGFGLDAGVQYKSGKWRFGLFGKDITSTFNAWSYSFSEDELDILSITGNDLPENSLEITVPRLIYGVSRSFDFGKGYGLVAQIDFVNTFDGKRNTLIKSNFMSIDPRFGIEASYKFGERNGVFVRGGLGNFQKEMNFDGTSKTTIQPNMGIGLKLKFLNLDYAFTDIGNVSIAQYSHVFSLKFDINKFDLGQQK